MLLSRASVIIIQLKHNPNAIKNESEIDSLCSILFLQNQGVYNFYVKPVS